MDMIKEYVSYFISVLQQWILADNACNNKQVHVNSNNA